MKYFAESRQQDLCIQALLYSRYFEAMRYGVWFMSCGGVTEKHSEVGSNKKRLDVSVSLCQAHILSQMALNLWFTFFYDS